VYGIDPATGQQRTCVKKPVFFVEGIDFKNKNQSAEGYDWRFGKCNGLGLVDFITRMEMRDEKYYVMSPDHPFYLVRDMIKELNDKGYDFIYLDFEKGSDYMQKNALVVIKLIQYINGIKSKNGSCEPNIVVGASMGGQVVKYALSMMEYYHLEHDSKLYVSFDSPHLGANIPIGFQLMAKFFTDAERFSGLTIKKAKEESKYSIDHKLSRPATKQLLNYHYESMGEHPERTKFLNELNMFGDFPSETFNFAISNGSGRMGETAFSGLNFAPGDNLFTYEITLQNIIDRQLSFYMPKKYIGKKIKNFFTNVISSPTFLNGVGVIVSALTQTPVVAQITQIITTASSSTRVYASKSGQRVFSFKPFFVSESSALNFYAPNAPEIDHVAGSLRSDISDMAVKVKSELLTYGLSNIVNTYNRKSFCFMPTPSTLAWKASPYHVAINTRMKDYLINMDLSSAPMYSKFGMVLFPDTNEAHVRITNFNKSSFINLLDLNIIKSRLAINEYSLPNIYGSTFNHNQSQGGELFITTLNSGAVYNINKPTAIGAYNYFLNEYTPGKNLNVFNRPCNNVTINSNALMEIYGYSNQFSNLYIVSGTQMVLNTGSKLNLYNNASLVIKSGAKLIINNGSQLALNGGVLIIEEGGILEYKGGSFSLNGASACLNIKGSLLVASGVMFAPVISGGYLLFDGNLVNYQSQVSVLNSKIKLSALNINDLVLKINQPELFLKSNQLIEISRGKIEFAKDQSRLIIDAPTVIKDVILTQSASLLPKKANGLQVNFKSGSGVFSNIKANNLNQAITVTSSSNLKALFNTLFIDNCNYGLVVYNGGIQLLNSNFNSNNNAVILNPITLSSEISGSTFESNGCAINVKGSTSVPIKLSSSKLNGNNFGYFITNGTISALRCNTFTNNEVPVIGKTDAVIDLRYGYNSFINSIDFHNLIVLEKAKDLLLENGYNYFFNQDKGKCLSDNIECKFLISGTITKTTNPCRINALNNAYYNLNSIITSSNYNRLFNVINTTCGQVIFNDVSPVLWPLNCGQYDLVKKLSIDSNLIVFDYHDDCSDVQAWEYSNYLYSDPLACMDLNFNQTLSGDFILEEEELSEIWPNPVKAGESLNFKFNSESKGNITIRVYDLLGKQVVEQRNLGNDGRLIIDQNLTKGLYIIQVSNSRDEFFTKKLLIE
jgi:hypothetical protein